MSAPSRLEADSARPVQWVVSFLFWGLLLLAAGLYAVVSLSPKLATYLRLRGDYVKSQSQLVYLEQNVDELRKIVKALESDPAIVQELARVDLNAARPGEERIPLSTDLMLQSSVRHPRPIATQPMHSWYFAFFSMFAENQRLRAASLTIAAALVLISFTFFQPFETVKFSSGWSVVKHGAGTMLNRYQRHRIKASQTNRHQKRVV